MSKQDSIIGIDVGSITVSIAIVDENGNVLDVRYSFHNGDIEGTVQRLLGDDDWLAAKGIACTSSTPDILQCAARYDTRVSVIAAAQKRHDQVGSILIVGGEKFGLISFDENGEYLNYRSNSSCAAGTGSFLDQQAKRLNLDSIETFCEIAYRNQDEFPKIASRCAVFAKTDLIHAQQEGFNLEAICDGLSYGLAKSIVDTLFTDAEPTLPLLFVGGVSQNRAVVRHLSDLLGVEIITEEYSPVYAAMGCALQLLEERRISGKGMDLSPEFPGGLFKAKDDTRQYTFPPLELKLSDYPDFTSLKHYERKASCAPSIPPVETDIYLGLVSGIAISVYLGIDIGSTSTKAVLLGGSGDVIAGFYTRTSGRPVEALQAILETISVLQDEVGVTFDFCSVGTTGSGRKFVGEIIGADLALDEITAHARAAVELNADVDTIIEIGGQDSKFTTLQNGRVTFSIMNNVCAAGTGSFIEEQAKKLGCPLEAYAERASRQTSPVTSDKCTVFMERDLNYYLSEGYTVDEALASALHAVRDNYLTKVAIEKNIGRTVFFQGATARNRALVAAFEQKLQRPIHVSRYCHLTGALGVALYLKDEGMSETRFRGLSLYRDIIPVSTEVCDLCNNHCKIRLAEVHGETVAFGFLCGRDYEDERYVRENRSGFDLIRTRRKLLSPNREGFQYRENLTVGIPAALHLFDEMYLWQRFFDQLSIRTVTSEACKAPVKAGKKIMGAEFCAPVASLHGHVRYLVEQVDYIFLPDYLEAENRDSKARRQYCYYTQFMPTIISEIPSVNRKVTVLNPVLRTIRGTLSVKHQLYKMLRTMLPEGISYFKVSSAYDRAFAGHQSALEEMKQVAKEVIDNESDISVVLLGRPYTVLSPEMNGRIPEIFDKQGVKTLFQDMMRIDKGDAAEIEPLLRSVHWRYAASILEAADVIAGRKGLYPVLVTSFKCTPDAFVIDLFKQIMEARNKPYLILQLDEHDSSIGYETRIEAGIRSFRNHFEAGEPQEAQKAVYERSEFLRGAGSLKGKTLLLPCYDVMPSRLIEAALQHEGIDARMVVETADSVRRGISLNTGQCMPASWMTQAAIDYIEKHDLDPAETVVWSVDSNISCNLGVMSHLFKNALELYGKGMEKVQVYGGEITYLDISFKMTRSAFFAFMIGGMLKKIGCRLRPYEVEKGVTDATIEKAMTIFYQAFLTDSSKEEAVQSVLPLFEAIRTNGSGRPKVAIFGDLYARDNNVVNQDLIRVIEANGGEAITTPYNEYMKIIANPFIKKWIREGLYYTAATAQLLLKTFPLLEKKYYRMFNQVLKEPEHVFLSDPEKILNQFNVKMLQTGESLETILKIYTLLANYSDIALFVQTSPSLCCPSLVTEAMAGQIEDATGIPVVTIEYDGTGGTKNEDIIPYLKFPRERPVAVQRLA